MSSKFSINTHELYSFLWVVFSNVHEYIFTESNNLPQSKDQGTELNPVFVTSEGRKLSVEYYDESTMYTVRVITKFRVDGQVFAILVNSEFQENYLWKNIKIRAIIKNYNAHIEKQNKQQPKRFHFDPNKIDNGNGKEIRIIPAGNNFRL